MIQHYVIKFVRDLRQVGGFLREHRFPPQIKTDSYDIAEILLKLLSYMFKLARLMKKKSGQIGTISLLVMIWDDANNSLCFYLFQ